MNVPLTQVARILEILPALGTPTVSTLADEDWVDISTVVEEKLVRDLIPRLYEAGARGIIELRVGIGRGRQRVTLPGAELAYRRHGSWEMHRICSKSCTCRLSFL